jgi:hypothetical protein
MAQRPHINLSVESHRGAETRPCSLFARYITINLMPQKRQLTTTQAILVLAFSSVLGIAAIFGAQNTLSAALLERSIHLGADWFVKNQTTQGDFLYEYDLAEEKYTNGNNIVRQAGGFYGVALVNRRFPNKDYLRAAERAVNYFKAISKTETRDGLSIRYIDHAQEGVRNNATSVFLLGLTELSKTNTLLLEKYRTLATEYANFLVESQRPDGRFFARYDPESKQFSGESGYNNGESFFALARMTNITGDHRLREATAKAAETMRSKYHEPDLQAYHWLMQGFDVWYEVTGDDWIPEYLFNQTDKVIAWPRYDSLDNYLKDEGPPTAGNYGVLAEGIAASARIAMQVGDKDHFETYLDVLKKTGKYVLQYQLRSRGGLMRGGFCRDLRCNTVRLDMQQHNLAAIVYLNELLAGK